MAVAIAIGLLAAIWIMLVFIDSKLKDIADIIERPASPQKEGK